MKARKIQESKVSKMPPYIREIWDWLLKEANHKDKKYGGFEVKRGQLFRTYLEIREGLSWYVGWRKHMYHENHTKRAMKVLRREHMIATRKALGGVLITVIKYDYYQDPKNYESTSERTNEEPMKVLRKHQPLPDNNKNDKNIKNDKKNIYTIDFKNFWDIYPRKEEKFNAYKEWQKLKPNAQLQAEIIKAVKNYKKTKKWREGYVKYAVRFLKGRMWEDEISNLTSSRKLWNSIK